MESRRNGSNGWMVRLAVFLFVVQAALLGFSLGASAHLLPRDQFGNVLCVTDGNGGNHKPSGKSDHHSKLMECCSAGCAMFGAPTAPPPTLLSLLVRQTVILSVPFVLYEDVGSGSVETPRSTRGPPLSV